MHLIDWVNYDFLAREKRRKGNVIDALYVLMLNGMNYFCDCVLQAPASSESQSKLMNQKKVRKSFSTVRTGSTLTSATRSRCVAPFPTSASQSNQLVQPHGAVLSSGIVFQVHAEALPVKAAQRERGDPLP